MKSTEIVKYSIIVLDVKWTVLHKCTKVCRALHTIKYSFKRRRSPHLKLKNGNAKRKWLTEAAMDRVWI
jgi:hypothetical protein